MRKTALFILITTCFLILAPSIHAATPVLNPTINFSPDESQVTINYAKGTWNFYRPDVLKLSWMQSPSNPFGGNIYWVSNSGSDSNSGSQNSPLLTIMHAFSVSQPGDIIYIQPGTYYEHIILNKSGSANKPIVISAAPGNLGKVKVTMSNAELMSLIPQPPQPVTNANGLPALPGNIDVANGLHDIWINGLVIEGYRGNPYAPIWDTYSACGIGIGGSFPMSGIHITNNVVYNALHSGLKGGFGVTYEGNISFENGTQATDHGMYVPGSYNQIIGNIVFNNTGAGVHVYESMYPGDANGTNLTVEKNIVFGNDFGILLSVQNSFIYNNVSVFNRYGLMYFSALPLPGGTDINDTVENNIFAFNSVANGTVDGSDGQTSTFRNNLNDFNDLYANATYPADSFNYSPLFINGPKTLMVDPLFVNAIGGDFRLQTGSPLIAKGVDIGIPFSGSAPNIGVFQTVTTPTPTPTPSSMTINYKIKLQGLNNTGPNDTFTFTLKTGSSTIYSFTTSATSDSSGLYLGTTSQNINLGIYDIYVKDNSHLQKKFAGITLTSGSNTLDLSTFPLLAGDFNNDNKITIVDIALILSKYTALQVPVDSTNQIYDIDGNGYIELTDIAPILKNYTALSVPGD